MNHLYKGHTLVNCKVVEKYMDRGRNTKKSLETMEEVRMPRRAAKGQFMGKRNKGRSRTHKNGYKSVS